MDFLVINIICCCIAIECKWAQNDWDVSGNRKLKKLQIIWIEGKGKPLTNSWTEGLVIVIIWL